MNSSKITNARTGQTITFLLTGDETGGKLLEMEAVYQPRSARPAPHYHPNQTEYFRVISGRLAVSIGKETKILHSGERLTIARGQVHTMWNPGVIPAVVNWKVHPALDTEHFLRTYTAFSNSGRANAQGLPDIFQLSLTVPRFAHVVRPAKPPYFLLQALLFLVRPFARLKGYKHPL